jgi:hypothetical protein
MAETIAPHVIRLHDPFTGNLKEAREVSREAKQEEAEIPADSINSL